MKTHWYVKNLFKGLLLASLIIVSNGCNKDPDVLNNLSDHQPLSPENTKNEALYFQKINWNNVDMIASYHTQGLDYLYHYPDFYKIDTDEDFVRFFTSFVYAETGQLYINQLNELIASFQEINKDADNIIDQLSAGRPSEYYSQTLSPAGLLVFNAINEAMRNEEIADYNEQKIKSLPVLSDKEKLALYAYVTVLKSSYDFWSNIDKVLDEYLASAEASAEGRMSTTLAQCLSELRNCIWANKWKIIWADGLAAIKAILNGSSFVQGIISVLAASGSKALPCLQAFITCLGNIGPPCTSCAPGALFYDGANCFYGRAPWGSLFTYNYAFYHTYNTFSPNLPKCAPPFTNDDGANCFRASYPSNAVPFFWQGGWYTKPYCP